MNKPFLKLVYLLGLRKPYEKVDALHYLKRLARTKQAEDDWYYSQKDVEQYAAGSEVLKRARYREMPLFFFCDPTSHVERQIIRAGLYGREILDLMCDLAKPGSHVIDVGANIGCYAIPFAKVRQDCTLHAVEPNPLAMQRLKRNLDLNGECTLCLHEVGLAAQPGIRPLFTYAGGGSDLGLSSFITPSTAKQVEPIHVEVVTLDDLLAGHEPVSLIKIDVQGYEADVLAGAQSTIRRDRPVILLEHEDSNFTDATSALHAKETLRTFFRDLNYHVHYMTRYDATLLFPVDWNRPLNGNLIALPRHCEQNC